MLLSKAAIALRTQAPRVTGNLLAPCASFSTSSIVSGKRSSFDLPDPRNLMSYQASLDYSAAQKWNPQLSKIVATIGPTSEQLPVMKDIVRSGMRIMRLNFSHATVEEVELRMANLKASKGRHSIFHPESDEEVVANTGESSVHKNVRAVLLDTRGPELRTGKLAGDHSGHETVQIEAGSTVTLCVTDDVRDNGSTASQLFIDYKKLNRCLSPGMKVLLDDGAIILTVTEVQHGDNGTVTCTADNSGEIRSRAGVNLPGAVTDLPAMSDKDRVDIKYGMSKDVDYVAASFIQTADGVREIKAYMEQCAKELADEGKWELGRPLPLIISKIESVSGLNNFDDILDESDGIMVARGDLGVEIPIQQVTNAQKEMVAACNAAGKPVIVATQMLESSEFVSFRLFTSASLSSLIFITLHLHLFTRCLAHTVAKNPRPTRAEVADVTNAIYDGADCVMLSGETAKGKYPVQVVQTMNEIIASAERFTRTTMPGPNLMARERFMQGQVERGDNSVDAAVAKAAMTAAEERNAAAIIVLTSHGVLVSTYTHRL
jgi:pyruvate kinase